MQIPLQITTRDVPHSAALDDHIREKVAKLELLYPHIMGCRVVLDMPHRHRHQGKLFNVRVDITVPGGELVVNREADGDVFVALRDAFDAAKRQIEDYGRRQRGDMKLHAPVYHGKVTRVNADEGYGFIETADGRELYFDFASLAHADFDKLEIGREVHFLEDIGAEGLQAKRISADRSAAVR